MRIRPFNVHIFENWIFTVYKGILKSNHDNLSNNYKQEQKINIYYTIKIFDLKWKYN